MGESANDGIVLGRIVELASEALALADGSYRSILAAKLADSLTLASDLLMASSK